MAAELKKLNEAHEQIIDAYFLNGYNGTRAVMQVKPDLNEGTAAVTFNTLMKRPNVKAYVQEKRNRLKAQTDIRTENVLKELINMAFSDATQYIDMSVEELKALPADARRLIQSFKVKKAYDKHGNHESTTVEIKLIDKLKAMEMINKNIGFYSEDNKQKQVNINLSKFDNRTLNVMLSAIEDAD